MAHSQSIKMSTGGTSASAQISLARQSLRATTLLDRPDFKGDLKHPSYAIDAEAEGNFNAVDRTDNNLSSLELGKKYKESLGEINMIIADMSGTMFEDLHGPLKPYPGVIEAFNLLKESGLNVILVTNSWKSSKKSILNLLQSGGFEVSKDDIFTSSDACKQYLQENSLQRPYYLVDEEVLQDFGEFNKRSNEDSVIVGLPSTQFDYRLLSKGMNLLSNGAPLITLNMMKREFSPDIRTVELGPGPFISMLTFCTDAEPVTMCKPYPEFYAALCQKYGCPDYSKVVVIGDDINEDVAGAKALGMKAVLTRTGRYQANDEKTLCLGFAPDATAESFAMAIRTVLAAHAVSQMSDEDCVLEERSSRGCGSDMSIPKDELLSKKMEGYVNADFQSQCTEPCTPVVKLPSYIW